MGAGQMRLALVLMTVEVEGALLVIRIRTYQSHSRTLPNKALHLTAIPLHSIATGELGRYV
jgi:hypothetical protein